MADVLLCLRNQTLFSAHRLVILANAEEVRKAEDVAALVEYAGSPSSDATLLIVSSGFASEIDRKIVAAIPKDAQKIFWELFENQKQGWITSFFQKKKIAIDTEAVEYILDMVENNTRDMRSECGEAGTAKAHLLMRVARNRPTRTIFCELSELQQAKLRIWGKSGWQHSEKLEFGNDARGPTCHEHPRSRPLGSNEQNKARRIARTPI